MENKIEINSELEEMRSQFKILTDKIEKQNIITKQLILELDKKKIRNYEFWSCSLPYIILWLTFPYVLWCMYSEGYPLWTYFSVIYLTILSIVLKVLMYKSEKQYLLKIGYDVIKYTEDIKRHKDQLLKSFIFALLLMVPAFIHLGFFANYLVNIGDTLYGIQSWWVYTFTGIILVIIVVLMLKKLIDRFTIKILE